MDFYEERISNHRIINNTMNTFFNTDNPKNRNRTYSSAHALICCEAEKIRNKMQRRMSNKINDDDWEDILEEAIANSIKSFDPDKGDFMALFNTVCINRLKDYYVSLDRKIQNEISLEDEEYEKHSSDVDIVKDTEDMDILQTTLDAICDLVLTKEKKYEKSPKKCYAKYIFSETVARSVSESYSVYKKIAKNSERFSRATDADFIDSFIVEHFTGDFKLLCSARLKKLSEFTGKEKDRDKECGYELNNIVYSTFLEISDGAVSQQRSKYYDLLKKDFL